MLFRVDNDQSVAPVAETTAANEALLEAHLEDWVERSPEMLGEDLLVIGRQVTVDSGKDRIDLLALDALGNSVVIELKRDWIGDDADLQAIRYASMVHGWDHAKIRGLAEAYWNNSSQERGSFTQELDEFCDDGYEVNGTQRIILAGRRMDPRVGTMAMWLRQHGLDVRAVSLSLFRDNDRTYLQPRVLIPLPTEDSVVAKPPPDQADKEWQRDGKAWHLEQQLAPNGRAIVESVIDLIAGAVPDAEGPLFGQKHYIAWRAGPRKWIGCYTNSPNQAAMFVNGLEHVPVEELAAKLGWKTFEATADLSEKFALGSSVGIDGKNRLRFTIKHPEDLTGPGGEALGDLLQLAWEGFAAGKIAMHV